MVNFPVDQRLWSASVDGDLRVVIHLKIDLNVSGFRLRGKDSG